MSNGIEFPAVFLLRAGQAAVLCLPTLLCGMLVAGALRTLIGADRLRQWFSADSPHSLLRAWLLAICLPVCAFGVLPILATLRAMRLPLAPIVVIALAGPLVTPWTLGYLLDRCGVWQALMLITASAFVALCAGFTVARMAADHKDVPPAQDTFPTTSALLNTFWAAGRSLTPGVAKVIAIGLAGVGALGVIIAPNIVGDWLVERSALHAAVLSVVPLLTYITPEMASMQAGEIVHSSTMPGLLVPLIGMGAAIHLGLFAIAFKLLGARVAVVVLIVVGVTTVLSSAAVDYALHDSRHQPDDSHAFENYGRPFHLLDHPDGPFAGFWHRFKGPLSGNVLPAGVGILVLAFAPMLRRIGQPGELKPGVPLSRKTLGAGLAMGVGVTLALTVYTYYPPTDALVRELRAASAEFDVCYRRNEMDDARRIARQIDRRLSQVGISSLLRGRVLDHDQGVTVQNLRHQLANLASADGDGDADRESAREFQIAFSRLLRKLGNA